MKKLIVVLMAVTLGAVAWAAEKDEPKKATENSVVKLTQANFQEKVLGDGVVIVDFWATWCPPCRVQLPIMDELAKTLEGSVVVGKVDIDKNKEIATKYGIQSIPTIIVFKDGEVKQKVMGVHSKEQLIQIIENVKK